jgi:hypothetical protein
VRGPSSTAFLRGHWRPLCTCFSQYFWSGTTSRPHLHFFPSVLRQRPGSRSVLRCNPDRCMAGPHLTDQATEEDNKRQRERSERRFKLLNRRIRNARNHKEHP